MSLKFDPWLEMPIFFLIFWGKTGRVSPKNWPFPRLKALHYNPAIQSNNQQQLNGYTPESKLYGPHTRSTQSLLSFINLQETGYLHNFATFPTTIDNTQQNHNCGNQDQVNLPWALHAAVTWTWEKGKVMGVSNHRSVSKPSLPKHT